MGFNLGDVFVTFKQKGEAFKKGLTEARNGLSKFANGAAAYFRSATAASKVFATAVAAVGVAVIAFGKKSVDAYFASAEATTKLRTNLLNVKGATEAHVQALEKQASALQGVGVIEDDVIKAGMSQLATFNLQGKTIQALTPKIADMVAQLKGHNATAEDMVGINNLVGKVMTGNVGALSRYGVTLSETQAEMLKSGNETERAAVLNEVLAQNYGKVNEQLRKTPQGRITALKNSFGDLQEGVGEFIVMAIGPLVDGFSGWITKVEEAGGLLEYFKGLIRENQGMFAAIAGAIMFALVPALIAMAGAAISAIAPLLPFFAVGAGLGLLFKKLADRMGGWGKAWDHIKEKARPVKDILLGVKDAATGVFEIVRLLITGDFRGGIFGMAEDSTFVDWLFKIRDGFQEFWRLLQEGVTFISDMVVGAFNLLWGAIKFLWPSIKSLGETFVKDLLPALKQIWDAVVQLWNALNPALMTALKVIGAILGAVFIGAIWLVINGLKVAIAVISGVISVISNLIKWLANVIKWYGNFYAAVINAVKGAIGWFSRLPGNVSDVIGKIVNWFKSLPGKIGNAVGGVGEKLLSPFKWAFNKIAEFWNSTVGKLKFKAPDWVPGLGGKGFEMPQLPTLALGTPGWQGGMAMLGEHGREAAFLPKGSVVRSAQDTEAMLKQSGGDTNIFNLSGVFARTDSELADMMERGIRALDRKRQANGKNAILGGA